MSRPAAPSSVQAALFSQKNRGALQQMLVDDFQQRVGRLDARQMDRLERTLDHYVEAVYEAQGDKPLPILNREVLSITAQDFGKYLQRQEAVRQAPAAPVQTVMNEQLFQETGRRFELLQQERQETKAIMPAVPNFRIALDDEGPSSVDLFEKAKQARESEARRLAGQVNDAMGRMDPYAQGGADSVLGRGPAGLQNMTVADPGLVRRLAADDIFRQGQQTFAKAGELLLQDRQKAAKPMEMPLIVPPDGRELALANLTNPLRFQMPADGAASAANPVILEPNAGPRLTMGDANSNPTLTIPPFLSPQKTNLPQDYLIRQDPVVTYKEIENNLFLYSADRNWLQNVKENRYSFTVTFDPAANGPVLTSQIHTQEKFKNIVRIELVKAILPVEGLDVVIQRNPDLSANTSYQENVLGLPYVTVRIPELENNNYGTDNYIDRSFGVLQYDANWYSDPGTYPTQTDSRGYTAMIPKFLKCQKVYSPTPLSTLQKLSIDLLRPSGSTLSLQADTFDISNVSVVTAPASALNIYGGSTSTTPAYFFIQTSNYFSRFQVAVGDNIRIGNYGYTGLTGADLATATDFANWLNREEGHSIVAIGYTSGSGIRIGSNSVGYANYIVIQGRYDNLTTGGTTPYQFGGSAGDIGTVLSTYTANLNLPRRLINLSRQSQFVFRVITRELDGTATLRPDNM
jgi:hypothetical protein